MKRAELLVLLLVPLAGACLDDKTPQIDCGQGDAVAFAGAAYCVYSAAIIIEGFDCPPDAPFGTEFGDAFICAPSANPPEGGWQGVIDAWKPSANNPDVGMPDARETLEPSPEVVNEATEPGPDMVEPDTVAPDAGEVTPPPTICLDGLTPGGCWDDTTCPAGWTCEGANVQCTPCVDCPVPPSGTPGTCRPAAGGDALGLMLWPGPTPSEDALYALFWIQSAFYTVLECPAFNLEQAVGDTFVVGPSESDCSGPITPVSATPIARRAPELAVRTGEPVRASGRYRTGCLSSDPATCTGSVDLVSDGVVLPQ